MGKKIVIAADSFKGSASSLDVGNYIYQGINSLYPDDQVSIFSIADGGEGTVDAIMSVLDGEEVVLDVIGPFGKTVTAKYGIVENGQTAVIEMAEASGITLVSKEELDILQSSTYGTGELILDALQRHVTKIYIGLGGSATNDGGIGLAAALGVNFLDNQGQILDPIAANLSKIDSIDTSHLVAEIANVEIILLMDVDNPLCGIKGASVVYGPQKGGSPEQLQELDQALEHYAAIAAKETGRDKKETSGAGAAGGLGFGLMTFFDAKAKRGVSTILELIGIEEKIADADLVITGEGHMDSQSINGKAPLGIANLAQKYGVPTVAIVGGATTDLDFLYQSGVSGVFDIVNAPMSLEEAIERTPELVANTAKNVIAFYHRLLK